MKRFLARTARLADTDARAAALVELDRNLADHVASALERNVRRWHEALAPVGAAARVDWRSISGAAPSPPKRATPSKVARSRARGMDPRHEGMRARIPAVGV